VLRPLRVQLACTAHDQLLGLVVEVFGSLGCPGGVGALEGVLAGRGHHRGSKLDARRQLHGTAALDRRQGLQAGPDVGEILFREIDDQQLRDLCVPTLKIEASAVNHDEHSMAWAYLSSPGVHFDYIDQKYSAREIGRIPDAVIEHDSAHDEARRASRGRFQTLLREVERRFLRTGRTRQSRLKGEMSVLVKASA